MQGVATTDTVSTKKKVCQEAALVGRACQALPDDMVKREEDEVSELASEVGEVFFQYGYMPRLPVPGRPLHLSHSHMSTPLPMKPEDYNGTSDWTE